jgi:peroxiredoxin (alkyl hydroperoxide reductase subunit C)
MITPGSRLPAFETRACVSVEEGAEFRTVGSADLAGKWAVIYTYPKDFTFVCPTEIVEFDQLRKELEERDAVVLGGSTDNEYAHLAWRRSHPQLARIDHPLLFVSPEMAAAWGVVHPREGVALRATLIVDPDGIVRHASCNDLSVGRSVSEVLRTLDALQTGELTPCGWHPGEATLG